jgi:hypothetical protein
MVVLALAELAEPLRAMAEVMVATLHTRHKQAAALEDIVEQAALVLRVLALQVVLEVAAAEAEAVAEVVAHVIGVAQAVAELGY